MAGKTASAAGQLKKVRNPITGEMSDLTDAGIDSGYSTDTTEPAGDPADLPDPTDREYGTPSHPAREDQGVPRSLADTISPEQDSAIQDTQTAVNDLNSELASPTLSARVAGKAVGPEDAQARPGQPNSRTIDSLMQQLSGLKKADIPGDTTDWDAKIAQATQLKQEGASRAAWANLAQIVGEGLVKIAAAKDARAHHIAPVDIRNAPPVFESLLHQNEQNYQDTIAAINHSHQYSQQGRQEQIMKAERNYDDQRKAIEDQLSGEKFKYGEDVRQVERGQDRAERGRMHSETLAATQANRDNRERMALENQQFRDTETERKTGLTQVNESLRRLSDRQKAAQQLASKLATYDDLPSKDQKHFAAQNAQLLGKAGISEESLNSYLEPTGTGFFARNFGEGKDPAVARKEMVQKNILAPIQAEQQQLLQERDRLSAVSARGGAESAPTPSPQPREAPSAPNERGAAGTAAAGTVRMRDPRTGKEAMIPKDSVETAKARGLVVVSG